MYVFEIARTARLASDLEAETVRGERFGRTLPPVSEPARNRRILLRRAAGRKIERIIHRNRVSRVSTLESPMAPVIATAV